MNCSRIRRVVTLASAHVHQPVEQALSAATLLGVRYQYKTSPAPRKLLHRLQLPLPDRLLTAIMFVQKASEDFGTRLQIMKA